MLFMFNTAVTHDYARNILNTLSLPNGCINTYEYETFGVDYIKMNVQETTIGEDVVICLIDRFVCNSEKNKYIPLRYGELEKIDTSDPQKVFYYVKLLDFIEQSDDNDTILKRLFDTDLFRDRSQDGGNVETGYLVFREECDNLFMKNTSQSAWRDTISYIEQEEIKAMFVTAFNQLMEKRSSAVRDCEDLATMLENTPVLDRRIEEAQKETDLYAEQNRALIRERATTGMSDEEYDKRVIVVKQHYTAAEARLAKLMAEKASRQARSKEIRRFLEKLKGQPTVREGWDEQAWNLLVSQVTIQSDGSAEFIFKGEIKITVRA